METDSAPFTFRVTEEAHEEPCEYWPDGESCPKVAVWRARLPGLPCGHCVRMYCDPHKEILHALDAEGTTPWQCQVCYAIGPGPILWSRP